MAKKQQKESGVVENLEGLPFDAYTVVEMRRSEIKSAPYNPRVINDDEKKRLREGLKRHKMVHPPTWNRRTGNLVGGHQRLSQLDVLAGGNDYSIQVAVIDVPESEEREINILLNNPQAQGDWDLGKLEEMLHDPDIQLAGTGFDMADVFRMFGDVISSDNNASAELGEQLRKVREAYEESVQKRANDAPLDYYLVVVFRSYEHRLEFLTTLELDDNRYQDGRKLMAMIVARERPEISSGAAAPIAHEPTEERPTS